MLPKRTPVALGAIGLAAATLLAGARAPVSGPAVLEVRVVARGPDAAAPSDGPLHARAGEPVELAAIARIRPAPKAKPIWVGPAGLDAAVVRGKRVAVAAAPPAGALVRWLKVEPVMLHVGEPGPSPGFAGYCNAILGGPHHGKWIGMDHVSYVETAVAGDAWTRAADAHPTEALYDIHEGLGTMRFKASLSFDGGATWASSPGAESRDRNGIRADVTRVSFREADDFTGWLTALFNVPEIFGSVEAQAERFIGADCADVIVSAARAGGHTKVKYTYVEGLWKYAAAPLPAAREIELSPGGAVSPAGLRWGTDVRRGDIVPISYRAPDHSYGVRHWPHVGVLYADASDPDGPLHGAPDGIFDGHDLLLHMSHPELTIAPLREQGPATIALLRWKKGFVP